VAIKDSSAANKIRIVYNLPISASELIMQSSVQIKKTAEGKRIPYVPGSAIPEKPMIPVTEKTIENCCGK
jgi:hypothetical protein